MRRHVSLTNSQEIIPPRVSAGKHEMLSMCWFNAGPMAQTAVQRQAKQNKPITIITITFYETNADPHISL